MTVFGNYAHYYDLLYQDKDYRAEVDYIHRLLQIQAPGAHSLLELGCGTGLHAALLSELDYSVCGVDTSGDMLQKAAARVQALPPGKRRGLTFKQGDLRTFRTSLKFDAVISLFHVMSYQTSNADLHAAFETAYTHLKPGGVFIFDCWYGPAVLTDPPVVRIKRFENDAISIVRIAEPEVEPSRNVVAVNYHMLIKDCTTGHCDEVKEVHRMRYLFEPEITDFCTAAGFELNHSEEWLSGKHPTRNTWYVCFAAQKKKAGDET